jgi:hypothetical protein
VIPYRRLIPPSYIALLDTFLGKFEGKAINDLKSRLFIFEVMLKSFL